VFLVDRDARQKAMSGAERLTHRRELAHPWVEEIREACKVLSKEALPKSALGKAVAYTLNQWPKLVRCLLRSRM
jgi:transposase